MYVYIYIYIYIYIYCHPQADSFVVSQLISVARHAGHFKLGLKPAQLYIRLSIIPLSQQSTKVSSGIRTHYVIAFVCLEFALPDTSVFNSYEELCIREWQPLIPSPECSTPRVRGAYILSSTYRLFRCITTHQCG